MATYSRFMLFNCLYQMHRHNLRGHVYIIKLSTLNICLYAVSKWFYVAMSLDLGKYGTTCTNEILEVMSILISDLYWGTTDPLSFIFWREQLLLVASWSHVVISEGPLLKRQYEIGPHHFCSNCERHFVEDSYLQMMYLSGPLMLQRM